MDELFGDLLLNYSFSSTMQRVTWFQDLAHL